MDSNASAPFMVYTYIENWRKFDIIQPISNLKELEKFVAEYALKQGIDTSEPFPFLISGQVDFIAFHIIMRNKNEAEHNHDKHNEAKVRFERKENQATLLGFYSTKHEGVFTHKGQFIHLHYTDADYLENGHVDAITLSRFTIWLPK
jgi:acetolactate decarboxylase